MATKLFPHAVESPYYPVFVATSLSIGLIISAMVLESPTRLTLPCTDSLLAHGSTAAFQFRFLQRHSIRCMDLPLPLRRMSTSSGWSGNVRAEQEHVCQSIVLCIL
ncbi:uncharacterized protein SCHCODRAFT_02612974 [Schizophyllum commune H4-8]|uniref:uncharacterized protein n=1 Tax=Schizophyllum commune (strain H4-8 / FGSC 9210) TaxID=578458 RepID=UPI0021603BB8|nr:uncharacterized protein SCHCODRAFT_02612974 [Schizophyllum commune H4-8]KAI5898721.1 hypothetical protein SCHCODRAFT_02612974 [Schizophyllum commune H4-8]